MSGLASHDGCPASCRRKPDRSCWTRPVPVRDRGLPVIARILPAASCKIGLSEPGRGREVAGPASSMPGSTPKLNICARRAATRVGHIRCAPLHDRHKVRPVAQVGALRGWGATATARRRTQSGGRLSDIARPFRSYCRNFVELTRERGFAAVRVLEGYFTIWWRD